MDDSVSVDTGEPALSSSDARSTAAPRRCVFLALETLCDARAADAYTGATARVTIEVRLALQGVAITRVPTEEATHIIVTYGVGGRRGRV